MIVTPPTAPDAAELARLGIIRVVTERFDVGRYCFTNLRDAIAEAKRGPHADNDS
jgi:hypothetical protein